MNDFLGLVKAERQKQINKHGYTPEHDDKHTNGSIADAGACYGANSNGLRATEVYERLDGYQWEEYPPLYPWELKYFKKSDHTRKEQLVIGAAFYMAEYERLERLEQQ